jgi:hypothetical protein
MSDNPTTAASRKSIWAQASHLASKTPESRNRYVDFLRAVSICAVVFGHWLMALIPIWFLAVYVFVVVLVPITCATWQRHGFKSFGILVLAAVIDDLLFFAADLQARKSVIHYLRKLPCWHWVSFSAVCCCLLKHPCAAGCPEPHRGQLSCWWFTCWCYCRSHSGLGDLNEALQETTSILPGGWFPERY